MGIEKDGTKSENFEAGYELHARQTIFAEGCHGSLTKTLIEKYDLRANSDPQTYGLGIKEIWEIDPAKHNEGHTMHTIGWPMDSKTYGGSWLYHMEDNQISLGFVVGLDYQNPHLSPYEEARALVEGGFQSLPKLSFAGGVLIGDTAGFLNVPKIKGNHTAMKSGMVAAESVFALLTSSDEWGLECTAYPEALEKSWIWSELKAVRNIRPGFHKGLWFGLVNAAWETLTRGLSPWTLKNHADHSAMKPDPNMMNPHKDTAPQVFTRLLRKMAPLPCKLTRRIVFTVKHVILKIRRKILIGLSHKGAMGQIIQTCKRLEIAKIRKHITAYETYEDHSAVKRRAYSWLGWRRACWRPHHERPSPRSGCREHT